MTRRDFIRKMGGGFSRALLNAASKPRDLQALFEVWSRADDCNRQRLERVFPNLGQIVLTIHNRWPNVRAGIALAFPKMSDESLDAEMEPVCTDSGVSAQ